MIPQQSDHITEDINKIITNSDGKMRRKQYRETWYKVQKGKNNNSILL